MLPTIIDLGFARINGYGTMIAIGVLLAWAVVGRESRRKGLDALAENLGSLFPLLALAAFLGGKLLWILLYNEAFLADVHQNGFFASLGTGFVFYGSLLAGIPVALWRFKALGVPVKKSVDALFTGAPIVHGFGRLGCFCAGCCYGARSSGALAVTFTGGMGLRGVALHPVQIYEATGELVIFLLIWFLVRKRARFDGQVALTYLILYACLRFSTEFLRGDGNPLAFGTPGHVHLPGEAPQGLTTGQFTSMLILVPALILLARGLLNAARRPAAQT